MGTRHAIVRVCWWVGRACSMRSCRWFGQLAGGSFSCQLSVGGSTPIGAWGPGLRMTPEASCGIPSPPLPISSPPLLHTGACQSGLRLPPGASGGRGPVLRGHRAASRQRGPGGGRGGRAVPLLQVRWQRELHGVPWVTPAVEVDGPFPYCRCVGAVRSPMAPDPFGHSTTKGQLITKPSMPLPPLALQQ